MARDRELVGGARGIGLAVAEEVQLDAVRARTTSLLGQSDANYIRRIVKAVREAVPSHLPVSAKIRLGYDDKELYMDNAQAVYQGGANELAVHARTKREGYKAPAHWEYVDLIRRALPIPVTANGEIWDHQDALACAGVSGCDALMVGRGAISLPNLANVMKTGCAHMSWAEVLQLIRLPLSQENP